MFSIEIKKHIDRDEIKEAIQMIADEIDNIQEQFKNMEMSND